MRIRIIFSGETLRDSIANEVDRDKKEHTWAGI